MLTYTACGAAGTVTGSMHIFTYTQGAELFRFGIDAGMFQTGEIMSEIMLNGNLVIDPKTVDAWILSHAHLDHTGRLGYVVKRGYRGPIYATYETQQLAMIVMSDAVVQMRNHYRQFEEKEYLAIQAGRLPEHMYDRKDVELYSDSDVDQTHSQFVTQKVGQSFEIHSNLRVEFFDASHILGSVYLKITEISSSKVLFHSADLGFSPKPYLPKITKQQPEENITTIFVESTYGDRLHNSTDPTEMFAKHASDTLRGGGQVIIPSFAIQRSQELIYYCITMMKNGLIPSVEIYLDSPMAINATEVYTNYSQVAKEIMANPRVHQTVSGVQSKELNSITEPCIIIAGSGMMNGGRIWQHLRFHGGKSKSKLLIVGYQAEGTHCKELMEGKRNFVIDGKDISLKLEVVRLEGFSGHADQKMLVNWVTDIVPQSVYRGKQQLDLFLIHGENTARDVLSGVLQSRIKSSSVSIKEPLQGQEFTIWKD